MFIFVKVGLSVVPHPTQIRQVNFVSVLDKTSQNDTMFQESLTFQHFANILLTCQHHVQLSFSSQAWVEIEYDDATSTIGTLQMVESHPSIYNLLKLEEIIIQTMIPSTKSTILGWDGMFMRPEIYALSVSDPWQDSTNRGAVPPDMGNSMDTKA